MCRGMAWKLIMVYTSTMNIARHAKKRRRQLIGKMTRAERLVRSELDRLGIKYVPQKIVITAGNMCRLIDFYLPESHIALEIDDSRHSRALDLPREIEIAAVPTMDRIRFARIKNSAVYKAKKKLGDVIKNALAFAYHVEWEGTAPAIVRFAPRITGAKHGTRGLTLPPPPKKLSGLLANLI